MNHFMYVAALLALPAAKEPLRDVMERHSEYWFIGMLIAGALAGLGCLLEVGETWHSFHRWRKAKKGIALEPEDETSWHKPVAALGLILVIVGMVGETVCECFTAIDETTIRSIDEGNLTEALKNAGTAKQSATDAATAAEKAKTASGKALDNANTANLVAEAAGKTAGRASLLSVSAMKAANNALLRADSLDEKVKESEIHEKDLESKLAHTDLVERGIEVTMSDNINTFNRYLKSVGVRIANPEKLVDGLKRVPRRTVKILYQPNDDEAHRYAVQLYNGFIAAKWGDSTIEPFETYEKLCDEDLAGERYVSIFVHNGDDLVTGQPSIMGAVGAASDIFGSFKGRQCSEVPDGGTIIVIPTREMP